MPCITKKKKKNNLTKYNLKPLRIFCTVPASIKQFTGVFFANYGCEILCE